MFTRAARLALIFAVVPAASVFAADLKVKTIQHVSSTKPQMIGSQPAPEMTLYVHDMAQRVESVGYAPDFAGPRKEPPPHTAIIARCDKGMIYQLDLDSQEYIEAKLDKFPSLHQFAKIAGKELAAKQENFDFSTVDTGETKDFYGHIAKHLVTTIKGEGNEIVVDGWYLDIPDPGCAPAYMRQRHVRMRVSVPEYVPGDAGIHMYQVTPPTFVYNWVLPDGLATQQTSTQLETSYIYGRKRVNEMLNEQEIVEFSEAPVDPSLFEVPPGFKKVHDLDHGKKR
jgi:hypothetical protein